MLEESLDGGGNVVTTVCCLLVRSFVNSIVQKVMGGFS